MFYFVANLIWNYEEANISIIFSSTLSQRHARSRRLSCRSHSVLDESKKRSTHSKASHVQRGSPSGTKSPSSGGLARFPMAAAATVYSAVSTTTAVTAVTVVLAPVRCCYSYRALSSFMLHGHCSAQCRVVDTQVDLVRLRSNTVLVRNTMDNS